MLKTGRMALGGAVLLVAVIALEFSGVSARVVGVADAVVSVVVPAVGAAVTLRALRLAPRAARPAWAVSAFGLLAATAAEIIWAAYEIRGVDSPSPSVADFVYLIFPLATAASLLLFPSGRSFQSKGRLILDGIVMASSLLIVSWLTVMEPVIAHSDATPLELAVAMAYPLTNVVALTVATVALARVPANHRLALTLASAGFACMTLVEFVYAYLVAAGNQDAGQHLLTIGWLAGMILVALAPVASSHAHEHGARRPDLRSWTSVILPFGPVLLAAVVTATEPPDHLSSGFVLGSGAVLVAAVLVRQAFAVAEDRRLMAVIADRAMRDPLTGLPNRALFLERLETALWKARRSGAPLSVLVLDLDDFKLVNDSMGHSAGDALLIAVAQRVSTHLGPRDIAARFGGDEFVVLLHGHPHTAAATSRRVLELFEQSFDVEGYKLLIRPSLGLAAADPRDSVPGCGGLRIGVCSRVVINESC